jgi:hypothetical protein
LTRTEVPKMDDYFFALECFAGEQPEKVEFELANGRNPNKVMEDGKTALFEAIKGLNIENIRVLINNGADVNHCTSDSYCVTRGIKTPLDLAQYLYQTDPELCYCTWEFETIYHLLLDAGAYKVNLKIDDYLACEMGRRRIEERVKVFHHVSQALPGDLARMVTELF